MTLRLNSIDSILMEFRRGRSFVLTSHIRPDGDAIGSLLALSDFLEARGCRVEIVLADAMPAIYHTLPGSDRIRHATSPGSRGDEIELRPVVVLECDSIDRTGLRGLEGRYLINIDHHASGRDYGDLNWIDPDACAVGAMLYELLTAAGDAIRPETATCVYAAILSDTGAFTSRSTTRETLAMAAKLAAAGADPARIANDLWFSSPECKVRLLGAALVNMQREGAIAWSWATLNDLERLHAVSEDCDGVVNYLVGIAGVEAAFFAIELPPTGEYRLSLRSKSDIDVARIAESFGGGGHRAASGCTVTGSLDDVIGRVLAKVHRDPVSLA